MIIVDSSILVAALLADDALGWWAAEVVAGFELGAPSIAAFESANIIRRHAAAGLVTERLAARGAPRPCPSRPSTTGRITLSLLGAGSCATT